MEPSTEPNMVTPLPVLVPGVVPVEPNTRTNMEPNMAPQLSYPVQANMETNTAFFLFGPDPQTSKRCRNLSKKEVGPVW